MKVAKKKEKFKTPRRDKKRPKASKKVFKKRQKASKSVQKSCKSNQSGPTKIRCCFCKCFLMYHLVLKTTFTHVTVPVSSLCLPHVEKTFKALHRQKHGQIFQEKLENYLNIAKSIINSFFFCYKIQNFIRTSWALIITTFHINF